MYLMWYIMYRVRYVCQASAPKTLANYFSGALQPKSADQQQLGTDPTIRFAPPRALNLLREVAGDLPVVDGSHFRALASADLGGMGTAGAKGAAGGRIEG